MVTTYKKKTTKADILAHDMARSFLREGVQPGDRLAATKELCVIFDTNTFTLNQALKLLEERGVIDRQPRRGLFLKQLPESVEGCAETLQDVNHSQSLQPNAFMDSLSSDIPGEGFHIRKQFEARFYTIESTTPEQLSAWKRVISAAERALPGLTVKFIDPGQEKKRSAIANSAEVIDIVTGSNRFFKNLVTASFMGFEADKYRDWLKPEEFYPVCYDTFQWDGMIYGAPLSIIPLIRYKSRAAECQSASFNVPCTSLLVALFHAGISIYDMTEGKWNLRSGDIRYVADTIKKVWDMFQCKGLYHKYDFRQNLIAALQQGSIQSVVYYSYLLASLDDHDFNNIKIEPLNDIFPGYAPTVVTNTFVNRYCEQPEKAWEFAMFCASTEAQSIFTEVRANFSARYNVNATAVENGIFPENATAVLESMRGRKSYLDEIFRIAEDSDSFWNTIDNAMNHYYSGSSNWDDVLLRCQQLLDHKLSNEPNAFDRLTSLVKSMNYKEK